MLSLFSDIVLLVALIDTPSLLRHILAQTHQALQTKMIIRRKLSFQKWGLYSLLPQMVLGSGNDPLSQEPQSCILPLN